MHCDGQNLLVLREGGRAVSILQFTDVSTSVQQLVKLELIQQATQVCMYGLVKPPTLVLSPPAILILDNVHT